MKKIVMLMLLSVVAPLSMNAQIHSNDIKEYVKILLARDKRCLQLESTRKNRNKSKAETHKEIIECEEVARLLATYIPILDLMVKDVHEMPDVDIVLFSQEHKSARRYATNQLTK